MRDRKWLELYDRHKGKIDVEFGKLAFTTPPLAAYHSVDAKFTTTEMAKELKTWALFGPPLGRTWKPTFQERQQFPEVRPLVSNPWTILHAGQPKGGPGESIIVDLPDAAKEGKIAAALATPALPPTVAAWHGTILPQKRRRYLAGDRLRQLRENRRPGQRAPQTRFRPQADAAPIESSWPSLSSPIAPSTRPERACAAGNPLASIRAELRHDDWYRVSAGKGRLAAAQSAPANGERVPSMP